MFWLSKKRAVLFLIAWVAVPTIAADPPLNLDRLVQMVRSEVQPDQAMDFMRHVYATDRWFTFPKFQETAEFLHRTMGGIGIVIGVALLVGFRPTAGPVEWIAVIGILVMITFALTWLSVALGMRSTFLVLDVGLQRVVQLP